MTPLLKYPLALLLCSLALPALAASNDAEKAALARLIHELDALAPLVRDAQDKALADTRIRLNYSWLEQDLERIKQGLREYLIAPSTEPRKFEPLSGDYRQ